MKIISNFYFCIAMFLALCFVTISMSDIYAQDVKQANADDGEAVVVPKAVMEMLMKQRQELIDRGMKVSMSQLKNADEPPVPFAACSDMGGENGWNAWQARIGINHQLTAGSPIFDSPPPPAPFVPRFNLASGNGIVPCTPGATGPSVPVVAPGFGNTSIQIGEPRVNGIVGGCSNPPYPPPPAGTTGNGCVEQLIYPLNVTAQDTNFIYTYALVIEDPGHPITEQPYVSLCIYDKDGKSIGDCGCFKYTAGNLPGFYVSNCNINSISYYKPWTLVGVNLSKYINQTLTIVITNVDCAKGGHFAYSYWDFSCRTLSGDITNVCPGQQTSLCGPEDPQISYTYQWYQNGKPYTGPGGNVKCITPIVQPGDTFSIAVMQPSKCNFYAKYVPQVVTITPNFTSTGVCGIKKFTDLSTTLNGLPIKGWNWSFPGGNPSTANTSTVAVTYPIGTYTATLIVTSQGGCMDTIALPLTVSLPVASFSSNIVCEGDATKFTDNSVPVTNDPITGWSWNFQNGNPATSTLQNPSVTFSAAGSHTATLIITSQNSCTDTVIHTVTVNPLPVANFSSTTVCFNNVTSFTNLSTGGATQWHWNFGDGDTSVQQTPLPHTYDAPGTYTVSLIATNSFGCRDTILFPTVVNPLPLANFSSPVVCFHDTTCFTDLSNISLGSITAWNWNFGDTASGQANISNIQNPCHIFFASSKTFNVILTVTSDKGCQSTVILPSTVDPLPV
ncbi:MAG: PKD domain-containing protein, partial [Bacteroidota bacterium]